MHSRFSRRWARWVLFGLSAFTLPVAARDTTLVTRIVYKDTSETTLRLITQSWAQIEGGLLRARQFEGEGSGARILTEQIFDAQGHSLRIDAYDSLAHLVRRSDLAYDTNGRLIRLVIQDASAPSNLRVQVIRYTLRSDGQAEKVEAADTSGNLISRLLYSYDGDNRVTQAEEKRMDTLYQKVLHHWSGDGQYDTAWTLAAGRDTVEHRVKRFNADGKTVAERVQLRRNDGSWFARETRSTYDASGRLLREDNYDQSGNAVGHILYEMETVSFTPVSLRTPPVHGKKREFEVGAGQQKKGFDLKGPYRDALGRARNQKPGSVLQ